MRIEDILTVDCMKVPLAGHTKEEIIGELIGLMVTAGLAENAKELMDSALEREGLMSTGIGKGVAIPHGRAKGVKKMSASFGVTREPVEFGSLDGQPVRIFFFIATPQNIVADHVRALALVSRILNRDGIRENLLKISDPAQVMPMFLQAESTEAK
jgi:fructose-specific phosphotransferase system IIA component